MVDIVIINWNGGQYIKNCVASILEPQSIKWVNQIILVDNDSKDGSIQQLPVHPKLKIIQNVQNLGFSKACNQGFKLCTANYVLLLNPDAQLLDQTLSECVQFMNERQEIDVLGCCLLNDAGNRSFTCSRAPSPRGIFNDSTGLSKVAPQIFKPSSIMTDWDHLESKYVPQVMGAFMFMRTNIFGKIGYFDERFFVYYEEVDFSKRLLESGGKIYYHANIKAIHSGEGTTQQVKGFRMFLNIRSRLQYAKKHFSKLGYALAWFSTYCIEPFTRLIFAIIKRQPKAIREIFKGYYLLVTQKNEKN